MLAIERETMAACLAELPRLVDTYQQADPNFTPQTLQYLQTLEERLGRLRSPLLGVCAAERAAIIAAADGGGESEAPPRRGSPRRAARLASAAALRRVEEALQTRVGQIDARLDILREKLHQVLAVSTASRPIPLPPTEPRSAWLAGVWAGLASVNEARSLFSYLSATLDRVDREYLLGDAIDNMIAAIVPPT